MVSCVQKPTKKREIGLRFGVSEVAWRPDALQLLESVGFVKTSRSGDTAPVRVDMFQSSVVRRKGTYASVDDRQRT